MHPKSWTAFGGAYFYVKDDMHPKSWTAFGGAYFYVKEKEIQHKVLARV